MNKSLKSILIVIPICIALAGLTVLICLLDPKFEPSADILATTVLLSVWAFFIAPSILFAIKWAQNYFGRMSEKQAFVRGYYLGYLWGGLIFLLFLLISPIIGVLWIINTIKDIIKSAKSVSNTENADDVFDM